MNYKFLVLTIAMICLVGFASALPTTGPVTVSANGVVFTANGGSGDGWFKWGAIHGGNYYWSTPNQSVSGAYTDYQDGPPLISGSTYYVVACDSTGCGDEVSFTVPGATPIPQTHYGDGVIRIMRGGFNLTQSLPIMVYATFTSRLGYLTYALFFFFIFSGWWLRQKDITIPMMVAIVFGFTIWGAGALATGIEMAPEIMNLGIGLIIAAIAGLAFSLVSK